jgi:hypothetical protein
MATNKNANDPQNIGPINFKSKDEVAIAIPNEAEQATDIIVMRAVSPYFLIYKSSWKVTGKVSRSVTFADDVQKVLEGAVSSRVRGDLDGQVFQFDGAQKIILFRKSNILTYIALVKYVNDTGKSDQEFDVFSYLERRYVFKLRADGIVHRHRAERLAEKLKKFQNLYMKVLREKQ